MNEFVRAGAPAYPGLAAFAKVSKAGKTDVNRLVFKAVGSTPDGVIVGVGAAAGSPDKLDLDGEFFDQIDLRSMAYDYCAAKDRTFKANHKNEIECDLVASWPGSPIIRDNGHLRTLKAEETLTDEMNVVGINIEKGKETHWMVAVKPRDPKVVELASKGGVAGFSVGVLAERQHV